MKPKRKELIDTIYQPPKFSAPNCLKLMKEYEKRIKVDIK